MFYEQCFPIEPYTMSSRFDVTADASGNNTHISDVCVKSEVVDRKNAHFRAMALSVEKLNQEMKALEAEMTNEWIDIASLELRHV